MTVHKAGVNELTGIAERHPKEALGRDDPDPEDARQLAGDGRRTVSGQRGKEHFLLHDADMDQLSDRLDPG